MQLSFFNEWYDPSDRTYVYSSGALLVDPAITRLAIAYSWLTATGTRSSDNKSVEVTC